MPTGSLSSRTTHSPATPSTRSTRRLDAGRVQRLKASRHRRQLLLYVLVEIESHVVVERHVIEGAPKAGAE